MPCPTLCEDAQTPVLRDERAHGVGRMYTSSGVLFATVAQEGVVRWQPSAPEHLPLPLSVRYSEPPLERPAVDPPWDGPPVPRL
jgi:hypothetical protein